MASHQCTTDNCYNTPMQGGLYCKACNVHQQVQEAYYKLIMDFRDQACDATDLLAEVLEKTVEEIEEIKATDNLIFMELIKELVSKYQPDVNRCRNCFKITDKEFCSKECVEIFVNSMQVTIGDDTNV